MMDQPIRILLVEDDEDDYLIMTDLLADATRGNYRIEWVTNFDEAHQRLSSEPFDGVIVDYHLGAEVGLDLVRQITEDQAYPVIVLTGHGSPEIDHSVMEAGACDFLVKGELTPALLERAIRYAIRQHKLLTRIQALSLTDELTGLYNRRGFITMAERHLKLAHRAHEAALVLFIDLDGMKKINDLYGHDAGDLALREAAAALREALRETDVVSRLGGDEFAALVVGAGARDTAVVLDRIQTRIAQAEISGVPANSIAMSIGAVDFDPEAPEELEHLLARADSAMYREKRLKASSRGQEAA